MKTITPMSVVICVLALIATFAEGTKEKGKSGDAALPDQHVAMNAADLRWIDGPPSLPPGAQLAVLQGDPGRKGTYTVRLKVPPHYKIPPHTHPATENVSVISGTMSFGMGDKFDEIAGKQIEAGGFASMPAGMKHYAWSTGETVVQIHGLGPLQIDYVNPADDPRNAKKQ